MKKTALLSFFVLVLAACGVVAPSSSASSSTTSTTTSTTTSSAPSSSTTTSTTTSTSATSSTTTSTTSSSSTSSSSSTVSSSSSSSEFVPQITTIQNARLLNNGDDVTVRGVVTRIIRQQSFFIQEGDFGINIFRYLDTENPVSVGDYVEVYGFIENYEGLLEITGPEGVGVSLTFLNETAPTITPFTITEETWVNANLATNFDGRLITIEGLKLKNAWVPLALNNESSAGVNVDFLLGSKTILARFDRYISVSERTALNTLFSTLSNADTLTYTGILGDYRGIQLAVAVSSDFTVNDLPDVLPTSVEIVTPVDFEGELVEGLTVQLSAIVLPENADNKNLIWSSEDETVATINSTGLVTGVKAGTTTLTVKTQADATILDTYLLTVIIPPPVLLSITLSSTQSLVGVGKTLQLNISYAPVGFPALGVTYASSDTEIATVDSTGLVTGIEAGTVKITATSIDNPSLTSEIDLEVVTLTNINSNVNLVQSQDLTTTYRIEEGYVYSHLAYSQSINTLTVNGTTMLVGTKDGLLTIDYFAVANSTTGNPTLLGLLRAISIGSYISLSGTVDAGTGGDAGRNKRLSVFVDDSLANLVVHQNPTWLFGNFSTPTSTIDMTNFKAWIDSPSRAHSDLGKFYIITGVKFTSIGSASFSATNYDYFNFSLVSVGNNNIGVSTTLNVRIGLYKTERLLSTNYNTTDTYTVIGYLGGSNADFTTGFTVNAILRVLYYSSITVQN